MLKSLTVLESVSYFSYVLLLLFKVALIVFLYYEVYVDVFVPLSLSLYHFPSLSA